MDASSQRLISYDCLCLLFITILLTYTVDSLIFVRYDRTDFSIFRGGSDPRIPVRMNELFSV